MYNFTKRKVSSDELLTVGKSLTSRRNVAIRKCNGFEFSLCGFRYAKLGYPFGVSAPNVNTRVHGGNKVRAMLPKDTSSEGSLTLNERSFVSKKQRTTGVRVAHYSRFSNVKDIQKNAFYYHSILFRSSNRDHVLAGDMFRCNEVTSMRIAHPSQTYKGYQKGTHTKTKSYISWKKNHFQGEMKPIFPYRKSFLCYWLLPFVGFVSLSKSIISINSEVSFEHTLGNTSSSRVFGEKDFGERNDVSTEQRNIKGSGELQSENTLLSERSLRVARGPLRNESLKYCMLYLDCLENYLNGKDKSFVENVPYGNIASTQLSLNSYDSVNKGKRFFNGITSVLDTTLTERFPTKRVKGSDGDISPIKANRYTMRGSIEESLRDVSINPGYSRYPVGVSRISPVGGSISMRAAHPTQKENPYKQTKNLHSIGEYDSLRESLNKLKQNQKENTLYQSTGDISFKLQKSNSFLQTVFKEKRMFLTVSPRIGVPDNTTGISSMLINKENPVTSYMRASALLDRYMVYLEEESKSLTQQTITKKTEILSSKRKIYQGNFFNSELFREVGEEHPSLLRGVRSFGTSAEKLFSYEKFLGDNSFNIMNRTIPKALSDDSTPNLEKMRMGLPFEHVDGTRDNLSIFPTGITAQRIHVLKNPDFVSQKENSFKKLSKDKLYEAVWKSLNKKKDILLTTSMLHSNIAPINRDNETMNLPSENLTGSRRDVSRSEIHSAYRSSGHNLGPLKLRVPIFMSVHPSSNNERKQKYEGRTPAILPTGTSNTTIMKKEGWGRDYSIIQRPYSLGTWFTTQDSALKPQKQLSLWDNKVNNGNTKKMGQKEMSMSKSYTTKKYQALWDKYRFVLKDYLKLNNLTTRHVSLSLSDEIREKLDVSQKARFAPNRKIRAFEQKSETRKSGLSTYKQTKDKTEKLLRAYFSIKATSLTQSAHRSSKSGIIPTTKEIRFQRETKKAKSVKQNNISPMSFGHLLRKYSSPLADMQILQWRNSQRMTPDLKNLRKTVATRDVSSKRTNKTTQLFTISPRLLLKNRLFITRFGSITDDRANVDVIKKRKYNQKKRRITKLKRETRRRKKRMRFYPRPIWLRYRFYSRFLKTRHFSAKNLDVSKKHRIRHRYPVGVLSKVNTGWSDSMKNVQESGRITKKNIVFAGNADIASRITGRKSVLTHLRGNYHNPLYWEGQRLNGIDVSTRRLATRTREFKSYVERTGISSSLYTISPSVVGELKTVLWKSYWLRSNLNPYLKKMKTSLNKVYESTRHWELIKSVRTFISSFLGFNNVLENRGIESQPLVAKRRISDIDVSNKQYSLTEDRNSDFWKKGGDFYTKDGFVGVVEPLAHNSLYSKWQTAHYLGEYNKMTLKRMQMLLRNIRENLTIDGHVKVRSSRISTALRNSYIENSAARSTRRIKNLGEGRPSFRYNAFSRLRLYWALSKGGSIFTLKDFNKRKELWNSEKMRQQTKDNKTKKIFKDLSTKLNMLLNEGGIVSNIETHASEKIFTDMVYQNPRVTYSALLKIRKKQEKLQNFSYSPYYLEKRLDQPNTWQRLFKKDYQRRQNLQSQQLNNVSSMLRPTDISRLSSSNISSKSNSTLNKWKRGEGLSLRKKSKRVLGLYTGSTHPFSLKNSGTYSKITGKRNYWWVQPTKAAFFSQTGLAPLKKGWASTTKLDVFGGNSITVSHKDQWQESVAGSFAVRKDFVSQNQMVLRAGSFLFHFCSVLTLLSISQVRGLLKFCFIGLSKLFAIQERFVRSPLGTFMSSVYSGSGLFATRHNLRPEGTTTEKIPKRQMGLFRVGDVKNSRSTTASREGIDVRSTSFNRLDDKRSLNFFYLYVATRHQFSKGTSKVDDLPNSLRKEYSKAKGNQLVNNKSIFPMENLLNSFTYAFYAYRNLNSEGTRQKSTLSPIGTEMKNVSEGTVYQNSRFARLIYFVSRFCLKKIPNGTSLFESKLKSQLDESSNHFSELAKDTHKKSTLQLKTASTLRGLFFIRFVSQSVLSAQSSITASVLGQRAFFESIMRSFYTFFEKPGELIVDWLAYMFLVEWASDITNTLPETIIERSAESVNKMTRQIYSLNVLGSFGVNAFFGMMSPFSPMRFVGEGITNLDLQRKASLQTDIPFMGILGSTFIQRRINYLYEIFLFQLYQPDTDLIVRQKKGTLFWDIWGDFLTQTAEDSNINISELTADKAEQMKLLEIVMSSKNDNMRSVDGSLNKNGKIWKNIFSSLTQKKGSNSDTSVLKRSSFDKNTNVRVSRNVISRNYRLVTKQKIGRSADALVPSGHQMAETWGSQQFLSFQGKDTELFIDLHPPRSLASLNVLKKKESLGSLRPTIGSLVCSASAGILRKQISKNVLVVGSAGIEKTLLVQAIAGETELKIITDNAYRYALVYRGVAVGIKLLRDVFDSLSLQTPCLFLIEDIHAIGERRPLLISDDDNSSISSKTGSQNVEIHEKNQVLYQLSKHVITHYKKPYKGDFSLLIPTNHFCFDFFSPNGGGVGQGAQVGQSSTSRKNTLSSKIIGYANNSQSASKGQPEKISRLLPTRLLRPSSELLSPPATSPFSVLTLKEEKKFKPHKTVSEYPYSLRDSSQSSGDTNNLAKTGPSYSIRGKVALLADMALSTLSVKLDMITDLLVILDSVKGNRGFVVFATTHIPFVLDPALRRPGRLDETISLGFSNTGSFSLQSNASLEILKSSFSILRVGTSLCPSPSISTSGGSLDFATLSSTLTTTNSNILQGLQRKVFQFISKRSSHNVLSTKMEKPLRASSLFYTASPLVDSPPFNLAALQASLQSEPSVHNRSASRIVTTPTMKHTRLSFVAAKAAAYLSLALWPASYVNKQNKSSGFAKRIDNGALRATHTSFFDLPFSESILSVTNSTTPNSTGFDSNYIMRDTMLSIYASPHILKMNIALLLASRIGEFFFLSGNTKTVFGQTSTGYLENINPSLRGYYNQITRVKHISTIFSDVASQHRISQSLTPLVLSFVQKRFIYNNSLFVPMDNSKLTTSLLEPPSPPSSSILLPAKRYENFKRSFSYYSSKRKLSPGGGIGIMEKINLHQQQRLVKRLYALRGFPANDSFSSETGLQSQMSATREPSLNFAAELSSSITQKASSSNWFVRNRLLMRHKYTLTNQWWNGQLPEHNAETTFLSDIDWRYSFIDARANTVRKRDPQQLKASTNSTKLGKTSAEGVEGILDFPDADQYYNQSRRDRKGYTSNPIHILSITQKEKSSEIYAHFIFDSFIKAFHMYEKNREVFDYFAFYISKEGLYWNLHELERLKILQRFYRTQP